MRWPLFGALARKVHGHFGTHPGLGDASSRRSPASAAITRAGASGPIATACSRPPARIRVWVPSPAIRIHSTARVQVMARAAARSSAAGVGREAAERVGAEEPPNLFSLARLVPRDGRKLERAVLGSLREQAEDVAQVRPGLDVAGTATREQRREERVDGAAVVAADEEPVFATMRRSA